MIKGEHLHNEINEIRDLSKKLGEEGKEFESKLLLSNTLILKLLLNIRQNQVATMPKEKLIQPRKRNEEIKED